MSVGWKTWRQRSKYYMRESKPYNGLEVYYIPQTNVYLLQQNPESNKPKYASKYPELFWQMKGYPQRDMFGTLNYRWPRSRRINGMWRKVRNGYFVKWYS